MQQTRRQTRWQIRRRRIVAFHVLDFVRFFLASKDTRSPTLQSDECATGKRRPACGDELHFTVLLLNWVIIVSLSGLLERYARSV